MKKVKIKKEKIGNSTSTESEASSSNLIPISVMDRDTGRRLSLEVEKTATVKDVKVMIEKLEGIPTYKQRLKYSGKQLEDLKLIFGDCNVLANSTLMLVETTRSNVSPLAVVQISIETLTGKTIHLDVKNTITVEGVKLALQDKEGLPPNQQRLVFRGQTLDDSRLLVGDYGVS